MISNKEDDQTLKNKLENIDGYHSDTDYETGC